MQLKDLNEEVSKLSDLFIISQNNLQKHDNSIGKNSEQQKKIIKK